MYLFFKNPLHVLQRPTSWANGRPTLDAKTKFHDGDDVDVHDYDEEEEEEFSDEESDEEDMWRVHEEMIAGGQEEGFGVLEEM